MRIITCTRCPASRTLSLDGGLAMEFFLFDNWTENHRLEFSSCDSVRIRLL